MVAVPGCPTAPETAPEAAFNATLPGRPPPADHVSVPDEPVAENAPLTVPPAGAPSTRVDGLMVSGPPAATMVRPRDVWTVWPETESVAVIPTVTAPAVTPVATLPLIELPDTPRP